MWLWVAVAACLVLGACAEGDDARQTTSQMLGDNGDGATDSTTGGPGMTSMSSNTWTPATEGEPGTGSGSSGTPDPDTSSDGGDDSPVDPYEPCQGQEAPVDPGEHWRAFQPQAGPRFIGSAPVPGGLPECDPFAQDCPDGEKCMPWADDGGATWNATRCSPIADNPGQVGDDCIVEGSDVSGIDSCDLGVMCFDVDSETNEGTCVEMCSGSEDNPTCETPETTCSISNSGALVLCQPICNPLANECAADEGCYFVTEASVCAPDASGDMGAAGDPCMFINACDDGLFCADGSVVAGCDSEFCCAPFCVAGDDSMCEAGESCVAFFPDGSAPASCLEGLGACGQ